MISPQGCASREKAMSLMKSIPCYISLVEIANVMQCERNPPTSFSTLSLNRRVSVAPRYISFHSCLVVDLLVCHLQKHQLMRGPAFPGWANRCGHARLLLRIYKKFIRPGRV